MAEPNVLTEDTGRIAVLTINCPEKRATDYPGR